METIDLYSTHSEYLGEIFKIKGPLKHVIEFGTGNYSTGLLIDNSQYCVAIEMQSEEWYNKMVSVFGDKINWKSYLKLGPMEWCTIDFSRITFDMGFVDGHGDSRPECINFLMEKDCPIIVSHDTEHPAYGWERVNSQKGYDTLTFKKYENWTTIWSKDIELMNELRKRFQDEL